MSLSGLPVRQSTYQLPVISFPLTKEFFGIPKFCKWTTQTDRQLNDWLTTSTGRSIFWMINIKLTRGPAPICNIMICEFNWGFFKSSCKLGFSGLETSFQSAKNGHQCVDHRMIYSVHTTWTNLNQSNIKLERVKKSFVWDHSKRAGSHSVATLIEQVHKAVVVGRGAHTSWARNLFTWGVDHKPTRKTSRHLNLGGGGGGLRGWNYSYYSRLWEDSWAEWAEWVIRATRSKILECGAGPRSATARRLLLGDQQTAATRARQFWEGCTHFTWRPRAPFCLRWANPLDKSFFGLFSIQKKAHAPFCLFWKNPLSHPFRIFPFYSPEKRRDECSHRDRFVVLWRRTGNEKRSESQAQDINCTGREPNIMWWKNYHEALTVASWGNTNSMNSDPLCSFMK